MDLNFFLKYKCQIYLFINSLSLIDIWAWSREGSRDTIERANTRASVRVDIYHQIFVILYS